jgi:hypothetical protein
VLKDRKKAGERTRPNRLQNLPELANQAAFSSILHPVFSISGRGEKIYVLLD